MRLRPHVRSPSGSSPLARRSYILSVFGSRRYGHSLDHGVEQRPGDTRFAAPALVVRDEAARGGVHTGTARVLAVRSIVVQNRADAAILGEQRVAAEPEQVEVER